MNCSVKVSDQFEKELKKFTKKYPSLKGEFIELVEILQINPYQGIFIGNNCYKIRLAISSKGKGKSGGARVITYIKINENTILLLSIYSKGEKDSISDKEILILLNKYTR